MRGVSIALALLSVGFNVSANAEPLKRFEVRDSIEMAQFIAPALLSPDGRSIATVTQRGLLDRNALEATIWLADAAAVRNALKHSGSSQSIRPIAMARLAASINGGNGDLGHGLVITRLAWEAGGRSLLFLGRDGRENRQVFRIQLDDRKVTPLSPATQDAVDYAFSGDKIVYLAGPDVQADHAWWSNDPSAPDIVEGSGWSLYDVLYPNYSQNARFMPTEFSVWQLSGAAPPQPVVDAATGRPLQVLGSYNVGAMALSHDGSRLLVLAHADHIPREWERYEVPAGLNGNPFRADAPHGSWADYTRAVQYQLIDLKEGTRRPLVQAPAADFMRGAVDVSQAQWSSDDRYLAVTGTFLPLDAARATRSLYPCGLAVVAVESQHIDCLIDHGDPKSIPVQTVAWGSRDRRLIVQSNESDSIFFMRRGNRWRPGGPGPRPALSFTVHEDLNTPPALVVRDPVSGKSITLFDPNPQLQRIALGDVSIYRWTSARGLAAEGGLAKPPDFIPGHRYPLVIQTHGFPKDKFFRVGFGSDTAVAGRSLAGRGLLVLQVREPHSPHDSTAAEATERGTEVYLAAVDQLAREGLVDPSRVGITGYSRAGFFVAKAITEAPQRFAAAAVVNTEPGAMFGYVAGIDYSFPDNARNWASLVAGAPPYGAGLNDWLAHAPGLHTDNISAAVLVSAGDPQHLLGLWSLYASLRDQHKPVELQYIRSGQHNLTKPAEVFAHQDELVDWFDFWLNDHESPDPAKAEQYARWQRLRENRTAALSSHAGQ
jgi:dipeptidyl aminopeptidase/acylaminoacyl peptidase